MNTKAGLDNVGTKAAALTFAMFLSVLPLLLLGLWISGRVAPVGSDWLGQVFDILPGLEEFTARDARRLLRGDLTLGLVAAAGALWAASGMSSQAQTALGGIFDRRPGGLTSRVWALAATIILLVLLIASAVASAALGTLRIPGLPDSMASLLARLVVLPGVLGFVLVTYWLLTPGRAVPIRDHLSGAVLFTAGWTVLTIAGTVLVDRAVAQASALYGTIGTVFGLLVFLRLTSSLFLYGAELSSVLRRDRATCRAATHEQR